MLIELCISDIVLIDQLTLSFGPGLSAMTGETGAGKSIILDALGLALGQRAEKGLVRTNCSNAKVIAVFAPDPKHPVWALLQQKEFAAQQDEDLILRRTLSADGKSRAFINDTPISASLLREVGAQLVEVHGQHDGRGLMDERTHIQSLDSYGAVSKTRATCHEAWKKWQQAKRRAEDLSKQANMDANEQLYLSEAAAELDRLNPKKGEEEQLAAARSTMMQSEQLLADVQGARTALENGPGIDGQIGTALRHVEQAIGRFGHDSEHAAHDALRLSHEALERVLVELDEAGTTLIHAARDLVIEPEHLEQSEERLFALRAMARKHRVEVDQLEQVRQDLSARLATLENMEHAQKEADQAVQQSKQTYIKHAEHLSKQRRRAAQQLDAAILQELAPLRLEKAKFKTKIEQVDVENGGPGGIDRVAFAISANPGMALGPLASIASGGELSRISLAIKAAMSNMGGPAIMIFDEIDQGVGGAVADAVGRRLATLSQTTQVLVITHSPQVAARASAQFQIEKSEKDGLSRTDVRLLPRPEREEEIARMLAGAKITDEARQAAKALLN